MYEIEIATLLPGKDGDNYKRTEVIYKQVVNELDLYAVIEAVNNVDTTQTTIQKIVQTKQALESEEK